MLHIGNQQNNIEIEETRNQVCNIIDNLLGLAEKCKPEDTVENLMLEADELGLGTVLLGIAPLVERMNHVRHILNVPNDLEAFAIIPCGYPLKETKQQDRFEESRIHFL